MPENLDEDVRSITTAIFDLQFPAEIWRIILREACEPLTEEEMLISVERRPREGDEPIREPNYRFILSSALTCRTFAALALPFLYHFIRIPPSSPHRTPELLKLVSTLRLPLPKVFGDEDRTYSDLVRFAHIEEIDAVSKILNSCHNITHLVIGGNDEIQFIPDFGTMLSKLESLVALRMKTCISPSPAENDISTLPRPTLQNLRVLTLSLHVGSHYVLDACSWDIPNLRVVSFGYIYASPNSVTGEEFLQIHGSNIQSLGFEGSHCTVPKAPLLEVLCPHLTHLQVETPSRLLGANGTDGAEAATTCTHRGIRTVTFSDMTWESITDEHRGFDENDITVLQNLCAHYLPSLKEVRCLWIPASSIRRRARSRQYREQLHFRIWFRDLLWEWERRKIRFVRSDTDKVISLDDSEMDSRSWFSADELCTRTDAI
ncbi:hypothetical protein SISNIDRAFT_491578 [Sistotremastrum niveocremeum HHB9708]|uniref:F-box domain-containing protein n=1 Tax=Sistotremastrum niveocremeum HHB9708 TaxID=1314777 RepID=A0A164MM52_9AGAM|nr:hypothetical protein SISNIDRAFT_491578 [Sistotremastrum niveocremeum HHB9708]